MQKTIKMRIQFSHVYHPEMNNANIFIISVFFNLLSIYIISYHSVFTYMHFSLA